MKFQRKAKTVSGLFMQYLVLGINGSKMCLSGMIDTDWPARAEGLVVFIQQESSITEVNLPGSTSSVVSTLWMVQPRNVAAHGLWNPENQQVWNIELQDMIYTSGCWFCFDYDRALVLSFWSILLFIFKEIYNYEDLFILERPWDSKETLHFKESLDF